MLLASIHRDFNCLATSCRGVLFCYLKDSRIRQKKYTWEEDGNFQNNAKMTLVQKFKTGKRKKKEE